MLRAMKQLCWQNSSQSKLTVFSAAQERTSQPTSERGHLENEAPGPLSAPKSH